MRIEQPLKQILSSTRRHWDRPETRNAVRQNFARMIDCRTPALGAEVYASETEEKLVYHTCKSRTCPSCGIGPPNCGNGSSGPVSPTSRMQASCLRCQTFSGQSFSRTAISSTTCLRSGLR